MTVNPIPAMTPSCVHNYLYTIGKNWTGQGIAMELGSWLGATAVPLARGLVEAGYDKPLCCYDRWRANEEEAVKAGRQGVKIKKGQDLLPIFMKNILPIYHDVWTYQGSITTTLQQRGQRPIEICIFDAPKRNPVFMYAVETLSPFWIPGVTIWGLLDYTFYKRCRKARKRKACMVQMEFVEQNKKCFTELAKWPKECSCVFFRYKGGL